MLPESKENFAKMRNAHHLLSQESAKTFFTLLPCYLHKQFKQVLTGLKARA